jgi:hypothetical protein
MSAGPVHVNPDDYAFEEPPSWVPPDWLLAFARHEVWPFLDSDREAAKVALACWLADQAAADERLRQLDLLDVAVRRLSCTPETEGLQDQLAARISERVSRFTSAYCAAPVNVPLPPPRNRTLDRDSCVAALIALNDETRDPAQRIGPGNSSLYSVLCYRVRELTEGQLPDLRAILRTAQLFPPGPTVAERATALPAAGEAIGTRPTDGSRHEEPPAGGARGSKRGTVNQRMLEQLQRDPTSAYWTQRKWAGFLSCRPSAVAKAPAWQTAKAARALAIVDRLDRPKTQPPK